MKGSRGIYPHIFDLTLDQGERQRSSYGRFIPEWKTFSIDSIGRCEERILLPLLGIELGFVSFQPVAMSHFEVPFLSIPSFPKGSHSSDFPTQIVRAFLISAIHATRPTHIIVLHMIPLITLLNITTHTTRRHAIFFVIVLFPLSLVPNFPLSTLYPNILKTLNILTNEMH